MFSLDGVSNRSLPDYWGLRLVAFNEDSKEPFVFEYNDIFMTLIKEDSNKYKISLKYPFSFFKSPVHTGPSESVEFDGNFAKLCEQVYFIMTDHLAGKIANQIFFEAIYSKNPRMDMHQFDNLSTHFRDKVFCSFFVKGFDSSNATLGIGIEAGYDFKKKAFFSVSDFYSEFYEKSYSTFIDTIVFSLNVHRRYEDFHATEDSDSLWTRKVKDPSWIKGYE